LLPHPAELAEVRLTKTTRSWPTQPLESTCTTADCHGIRRTGPGIAALSGIHLS
jgi:hypothetical protein